MKLWKKHKTKSTGLLIAVLGAAQVGLPSLAPVIGPKAFGIATFLLGLTVAAIGFWNSHAETKDEHV